MIITTIQASCTDLFQINHLGNYYRFHPLIVILKTFNLDFPFIEVWFPHQTSKPLEIEDTK